MKTTQYNLYGTEGCHLCEIAEEICVQLISRDNIEYVDIIEEPRLVELYGTSIPVLEHLNSHMALYWPFNKEQLQEFISGTN
ncbi:glutaredoxin family protein [Thalassotalea psychrophila]|uniref:Glutaredoxin family protein n=1 Tax=Thalassotalea psychrophila TaxID=3065647 RepID=A0ABY9TP23_9GAMM|nr:glutaredoxin family protein [Colwelliaceae bacterium SQ149]